MDKLKNLLLHTDSLVLFGIIIIATIIVAWIASNYFHRLLRIKAKEQNADITSFIFLKQLLVAIIYCLGFGWAFLVLPVTRTFAHTLIAGAGATTLILGFASQQLFTNLISGVFLVIRKPFKINDVIEFQGSRGKVISINLNSTIIEDDNGNKIIIPSSMLINDVIKIIHPT